MDLLSLPVDMIENVFSYLSYDDIAKNRIVCKTFNDVGMRMLNRGFTRVERQHSHSLKNVKAQLPRRESERRYHPLSRHCDILTSIETRISMLNMTYVKYIDSGFCCFIPGKVIDEIGRILRLVDPATNKTPPGPHEVLQELRDISSMAIEHFDDKIAPAFRKSLPKPSVFVSDVRTGINEPTSTLNCLLNMKAEVRALNRLSSSNVRLSLYLASQHKKFFSKINVYKKVLAQQRRTIEFLNHRQNEQDATIADLKKRIEGCNIKYSTLGDKTLPTGDTVIGESPATAGVATCAPRLRHFASQIKLDLSVLPIGTNRRAQLKRLPNVKARRPIIVFPSLSDDDTSEGPGQKKPKLDPNPKPSTSSSIVEPSDSGKSSESSSKRFLLDNIGSNSTFRKRSYSFSTVDDIISETSKKAKFD